MSFRIYKLDFQEKNLNPDRDFSLENLIFNYLLIILEYNELLTIFQLEGIGMSI